MDVSDSEYASDRESEAAQVPADASQTIAERGSHGEAVENHEHIAGMWTAYLDNKLPEGVSLSGADVANMMVQLKQSRSVIGEPVRDHFVDVAGYSGIAFQCHEASSGEDADFDDPIEADVDITEWDEVEVGSAFDTFIQDENEADGWCVDVWYGQASVWKPGVDPADTPTRRLKGEGVETREDAIREANLYISDQMEDTDE